MGAISDETARVLPLSFAQLNFSHDKVQVNPQIVLLNQEKYWGY